MTSKLFRVVLAVIGVAWLTVSAQTERGVPDGNYLLMVEVGGKQERLNVKIHDGKVRCVKATDASLANVEGFLQKAEMQGVQGVPPNAFLGRFRNGIGSQLWILRADGTFAVREIPDRGEQQSAVPVKGDSLDVPKKK